jgi:hypothetical protein
LRNKLSPPTMDSGHDILEAVEFRWFVERNGSPLPLNHLGAGSWKNSPPTESVTNFITCPKA